MDKIYDSKVTTDDNRKPMAAESGAHTASRAVNPSVEDAYWREHYGTRDYVIRHRPYEDYQSAYRYGWESRERMGARVFRDVERDLASGWEKAKGESKLAWTEAKHAAEDAWQRVKRH